MTTIPDGVLELAPWSTSMADLALACGWAFDKKYRQKVKSLETPPESQTVGLVIHKVLEIAIQGVDVDHVFRQVLPSFDLTHNLKEEVLTFRDAVVDFIDRIGRFKKQFGVMKTVPEKRVAISPAFTSTNFFDKKGLFRGVIDATLITQDKRCVVLDHKTGAHKPLSMYQDQLEGYAVMMTATYPELTAVRAGIHYVGGDPQPDGKRIVWAREHTAEYVNTRLRQTLVMHLAHAAEEAKSNTPKKSWMCNYCGYKPICPLY